MVDLAEPERRTFRCSLRRLSAAFVSVHVLCCGCSQEVVDQGMIEELDVQYEVALNDLRKMVVRREDLEAELHRNTAIIKTYPGKIQDRQRSPESLADSSAESDESALARWTEELETAKHRQPLIDQEMRELTDQIGPAEERVYALIRLRVDEELRSAR